MQSYIIWIEGQHSDHYKRPYLALIVLQSKYLVVKISDKSSLVARYFISLQAVNMN